jgi:large subunit ribosomal protein L17
MALLRGLVLSLFRNDRVETTVAKAKEVRRIADRLITMARNAPRPDDSEQDPQAAKQHVAARRNILKVITDKRVVAHLFEEIAGRFAERDGGYARVTRAGRRRGDGAELAVVDVEG